MKFLDNFGESEREERRERREKKEKRERRERDHHCILLQLSPAPHCDKEG